MTLHLATCLITVLLRAHPADRRAQTCALTASALVLIAVTLTLEALVALTPLPAGIGVGAILPLAVVTGVHRHDLGRLLTHWRDAAATAREYSPDVPATARRLAEPLQALLLRGHRQAGSPADARHTAVARAVVRMPVLGRRPRLMSVDVELTCAGTALPLACPDPRTPLAPLLLALAGPPGPRTRGGDLMVRATVVLRPDAISHHVALDLEDALHRLSAAGADPA